MVSIGTTRMPPFVERRMTQYLQAREQPRSVSTRNMSRRIVCGVRMAAHAGKSDESTLAFSGRIAPWISGTKTCGMRASAASCAARPDVASIVRSTSTTSSSASPMTIASQNAARGSGFENVSGPPPSTNGWRSSRSRRSAGICAASSSATTPASSIS